GGRGEGMAEPSSGGARAVLSHAALPPLRGVPPVPGGTRGAAGALALEHGVRSRHGPAPQTEGRLTMYTSTRRSRVWCAALATVLSTGLGLATAALGQDSPKTSCPDGQMATIESKPCPATNMRPAVMGQRACCTKLTEKNPGGETRCKSFPHCPRNSPS